MPENDPCPGLDQLVERLDIVRAKRVAVIVNHTSRTTSGEQLIDLLPTLGADLRAIFTPEHGLFGTEEAGKHLEGTTYRGTPVISLYGRKLKPDPADLEDLDLLIYDIQDVACRFYTYISTMTLAMEAAADAGVHFLILDRPCLRGGRDVSGPIREDSCASFVGYLPIPIAYGMTPGELAGMILGETWLGARSLVLTVIPVRNWKRSAPHVLPGSFVPPSPNLPTMQSVIAYPGTCLIEATNLSEGRGTPAPFLTIGAPWIDGERLAAALNERSYEGVRFLPAAFTPKPLPGKALRPKYSGEACRGITIFISDPARYDSVTVGLAIIHAAVKLQPKEIRLKERSFQLLSGTADMHRRLLAGESPEAILARYRADLDAFGRRRERYLLYP